MKKLIILLSVLFFSITAACSTATKTNGTSTGVDKETGSNEWEYKKIKILEPGCELVEFPASVYNPLPDGSFRSMFEGITVSDSFTQNEFNIFDKKLIIKMEQDYTLYDRSNKLTYNVMIFNIKNNIPDGKNIKSGDTIGQAGNNRAGIIIFSETLDPYLVISSNRPPVYYAGYFWFNPSFMGATGSPNWMNFDPIDDLNSLLEEIADHQMKGNPGFTVYDQKVRFKTKLSQYPRIIAEGERNNISVYENILLGQNGIMTHVTGINAGGYNYFLCWQDGFCEYLKQEYSLGDDIWLYGTVVSYDVWAKRGYIFLRDYTTVSLEEIYEGRLQELRG